MLYSVKAIFFKDGLDTFSYGSSKNSTEIFVSLVVEASQLRNVIRIQRKL